MMILRLLPIGFRVAPFFRQTHVQDVTFNEKADGRQAALVVR